MLQKITESTRTKTEEEKNSQITEGWLYCWSDVPIMHFENKKLALKKNISKWGHKKQEGWFKNTPFFLANTRTIFFMVSVGITKELFPSRYSWAEVRRRCVQTSTSLTKCFLPSLWRRRNLIVFLPYSQLRTSTSLICRENKWQL